MTFFLLTLLTLIALIIIAVLIAVLFPKQVAKLFDIYFTRFFTNTWISTLWIATITTHCLVTLTLIVVIFYAFNEEIPMLEEMPGTIRLLSFDMPHLNRTV